MSRFATKGCVQDSVGTRGYGNIVTTMRRQTRLKIIPLPLSDANEFVARHHRHHQSVVGHKFSLGVVDAEGALRGVAIVGRPVARGRDDGRTLEVTRLATDGCPNACSALYSAAWRAGRAMGYERIGTYILACEPGTSLRAAGWRPVHRVRGRSWDTPSRRRTDQHPTVDKVLWEAVSSRPCRKDLSD